MTAQDNWKERLIALAEFVRENGHARVPAKYVTERNGEEINLGGWVSYLRTRHHQNMLEDDKIRELEQFPGWEWGPLPPGPAKDDERDEEIIRLREEENLSLAKIGERFGISRQRVHQILKSHQDA